MSREVIISEKRTGSTSLQLLTLIQLDESGRCKACEHHVVGDDPSAHWHAISFPRGYGLDVLALRDRTRSLAQAEIPARGTGFETIGLEAIPQEVLHPAALAVEWTASNWLRNRLQRNVLSGAEPAAL